MKLWKLAPAVLVLLLSPVGLFCQTWTFQGTQMCYHFTPYSTQCYSNGEISGYVVNNSNWARISRQNYEAGRQLGSGVASLAAALIIAWKRHHALMEIENENLREQLLSYDQHIFDLGGTMVSFYRKDEGLMNHLATLNLERASIWKQQAQKSEELAAKMEAANSEINQKARQLHSHVKKHKELLFCLNDPKAGDKAMYQTMRETVAKEYAVNEFLGALVQYYAAHPSQSVVKVSNTGKGEGTTTPAPTTARCTIQSEPPGADITIDGKFVGDTPSSIVLDPGDHTIVVSESGLTSWKRVLTVTAGDSITIDAKLETKH